MDAVLFLENDEIARKALELLIKYSGKVINKRIE